MYSYFWATFKSIPFQAKTALDTFWHLLEKFGLLFNSASGHTPRERERERERKTNRLAEVFGLLFIQASGHTPRERETERERERETKTNRLAEVLNQQQQLLVALECFCHQLETFKCYFISAKNILPTHECILCRVNTLKLYLLT